MTVYRDPWGRSRKEALAAARTRLAGLEARVGAYPRGSVQASQNAMCVWEWRNIVAYLAQEELDFDAEDPTIKGPA